MQKRRQKMYGKMLKVKQLTDARVLVLREEICKIDGEGKPCKPYKRWGIWVTEIKDKGLDAEGIQVWRSRDKERAEQYFIDFK